MRFTFKPSTHLNLPVVGKWIRNARFAAGFSIWCARFGGAVFTWCVLLRYILGIITGCLISIYKATDSRTGDIWQEVCDDYEGDWVAAYNVKFVRFFCIKPQEWTQLGLVEAIQAPVGLAIGLLFLLFENAQYASPIVQLSFMAYLIKRLSGLNDWHQVFGLTYMAAMLLITLLLCCVMVGWTYGKAES